MSSENYKHMGCIAEWQILEWEEAYSPLNVRQELLKMVAWLDANPKKARKKRWRKFITGWLARAHAQVVSAQVNARLAARTGSQGNGRAIYSADDKAYYERLGLKI